jgi:hypothetical protein
MPHSFALKLFIPATIRVMYSRTASDRRKRGRSLDAGGGALLGSGWLAGDCFDCSMYSSLSWTLHGGFQLREGKSSRYPTATRACL